MLLPDEIAAVATRIVDGYEQRLVGAIFDQLVAALGRDGVLSIADLRTLETAAGINREAVMRLVASHAPRIAAEVRSEVTRILRTADTADVETLSAAYAVGRAGASAAFARIAQETTEGLVQIIARENIGMAQRAQDVWYDVTAEAITSWNHGGMTADKIMGRAVTRLSREGFVTIDYRSGVKTSIDAAVRRHIVSQVAQASTRMTDARLAEYGHDLVVTSAHFGARPSHAPWQGRVFSRSGRTPGYPDFVFATGYGTVAGLAGANCVIEGTVVSGLGPRVAYRREYSGEVVTLSTASGKQLTVTPNHPILTDEGWVAAGLLDEGSNLICCFDGEGHSGVCPHDYQEPAAIEDIFDALAVHGDILRLPVSPADFHGDGAGDEVDVVLAESVLRHGHDAEIAEHGVQPGLLLRPEVPSTLLADSSANEVGIGALHASDGIMGGCDECFAFAWCESSDACAHRLGAVRRGRVSVRCETLTDDHVPGVESDGDIVLGDARLVEPHDLGIVDWQTPAVCWQPPLCESRAYNLPATAEPLADLAQCEPLSVQLEQLVLIERKSLSTHVYNLSTPGGWYVAGGIVTHNCRHTFGPYFPGITELPQMPERVNGLTSDEMYEATQKQRGFERAIRDTKREIAALEATGADATGKRLLLGRQQARLRGYLDKTGLTRQRAREKAYAIGAQPRALGRR